MRVIVVGGGVIGLSTALSLTQEFPDCDVTVVSKAFFPDSDGLTSVHGFGIIAIRSVSPTVSPQAVTWVSETREHYARNHPSVSEQAGIRPRDVLLLFKVKSEEELNEILPENFRRAQLFGPATQRQLDSISHLSEGGAQDLIFPSAKPGSEIMAFSAPSFVIDSSRFLPWMRNHLDALVTSKGKKQVHFVSRKVAGFDELMDDCDVIINCSGMGAAKLANDPNMTPVRGQYINIETSLEVDSVVAASETLVCPRVGNIVLGGVYQGGRYSTQVDPKDTDSIMRRCEVLFPAIKGKKILGVEVGIRPARFGGARVALEWLRADPKPGSRIRSCAKLFPVVHNYGHGGWGFSVHWGCGREACSLVRKALSAGSKL